jgi:hypothetical protein
LESADPRKDYSERKFGRGAELESKSADHREYVRINMVQCDGTTWMGYHISYIAMR